MAKRILIIEDDSAIVELIQFNLERESYEITSASTGADGLTAIRQRKPDLVILDLMLPEIGGLEVCREIRSEPALAALPIIMVTARGEESDRIAGLELGADDYITKPFSPRELVARVGAVLRRAARRGDDLESRTSEPILAGNLLIDPLSFRVERKGIPVPMTNLEFRLLYHLASRHGEMCSRNQILDEVWGKDTYVTHRSVDAYVRRLRQKLDQPGEPSMLTTVRGAGYRFEIGDA